jgi:hypothetical protein
MIKNNLYHSFRKRIMRKLLVCGMIGLALAVSMTFSGCSKKEPVAFDTLESARIKAKDNAEYNAKKYKANSVFAQWTLEVQGDSTQDANCPQGDGWASIILIEPLELKQKQKLKCSTVSNAVGCLKEEDFKTKTYSGDDGQCQPVAKVPFPLPTLAK